MAGRFSTTTKDVGLLLQLREEGQLRLAPEFQRNAVWTRPAKAYLIDTILSDMPIPVLYFQRTVSAQTNRVEYNVVDGQQRLNSLFQYIENRFSLTESDPAAPWARKRWKALEAEDRERILSYDFVVQELSGYSAETIREMFGRMNRYVVALSPQELRHASADGAFKTFSEEIGGWPIWTEERIFTGNATNRMKPDEFSAELAILLLEGPQDKKKSVDFYYQTYQHEFEAAEEIKIRLNKLFDFTQKALPDLQASALFRRPANFYALIGALTELDDEQLLDELDPHAVGQALSSFESELGVDEDVRTTRANKYQIAQSRQTDNVQPRRIRMDILKDVIAPQK
ncbi:MAG TPA: DUF262 domain-containing protein [Galbitalea sp.]|jgi:hypothetical protein|nr:DUF262 domain-containing protein [Galbitalea sp.]